jgi:hypothetical protein
MADVLGEEAPKGEAAKLAAEKLKRRHLWAGFVGGFIVGGGVVYSFLAQTQHSCHQMQSSGHAIRAVLAR